MSKEQRTASEQVQAIGGLLAALTAAEAEATKYFGYLNPVLPNSLGPSYDQGMEQQTHNGLGLPCHLVKA
jgi:hypothetical protein